MAMIQTRRPALRASVIYALGILVGSRFDPPLWPLLVMIALLVGLSIWLRRSPRSSAFSPWPLAAALLLIAFLQYEGHTRFFPLHHIRYHRDLADPVIVQGKVASEPMIKGDDATLTLEAKAIDLGAGPLKTCGRVRLTVKGFRGRPGFGDQIRLRGRLRAPQEARNPGEFDFRAYLARRSTHAVMSVPGSSILEVREGPVGWWTRMVRSVHQHLEGMISRTMTGSSGALLRGVMLGQRRGLPREIAEAFSDSGVIHVLAVSGLHVGLIVGIFFSLFCALRLKEPAATLLTLALIFLYMHVVDLRPSVVRATIMASVVMLGRLLERESDLLNAIAFAGLVSLLWNPQFLFELGFQLSFVATFSIVYLHGRLKELLFPFLKATHPSWLRWVCSGLLVSLSAQLGTLPIIATHFQKIPVISVVANLLVVPLIGLGVALGFTTAIVGLASMGLAKLYAAANWLLLSGLIKLVRLAAALPWAYLNVPQPDTKSMGLYYALLLMGANIKRSLAARRAFLFGSLILLNLLVWGQALEGPEHLTLLFFDVGQGDAALIRFPNRRTMLVDGGDRTLRYDCGQRIVCPYLRRVGISRLDMVMLSHADNDHVGGLLSVLEELPVGMVLDSGAKHLSASYGRFLELADESPSIYRQVMAGDRVQICPGVNVTVLHPTAEFISQDGDAPFGLNNASVVLKIQYGTISFLLTGDIEQEAEEVLLHRDEGVAATVVKVPHHGSETSSTEAFVQAVRPWVAVISVGRQNKFGHPSRGVLQRYQRVGASVYRTDGDGAVLVQTDGRKLKLTTLLGTGQRWPPGPRRPVQIDPLEDREIPQVVYPVPGSFLLTSEVGRIIISASTFTHREGKRR
jgi:competence protein ComEC